MDSFDPMRLTGRMVRFTQILADSSLETIQGTVRDVIIDPTSEIDLLITLLEGPTFVWRTTSTDQQLETL